MNWPGPRGWYDTLYGDDPSTGNIFGREDLAPRRARLLHVFLAHGGRLADFASADFASADFASADFASADFASAHFPGAPDPRARLTEAMDRAIAKMELARRRH